MSELEALRDSINNVNAVSEEAGIGLPFASAAETGLAWAGRIKNPDAVAAPIHELIVPTRQVPRLNDLTYDEEVEIWQTVKERVNKVLEEDNVSAAVILVNDGPPAGQTVGHVHFHVLGINKQEVIDDLEGRFDALTNQYAEVAVAPTAEQIVKTNDPEELAKSIRGFRSNNTGDDLNRTGFSIYTTSQLTKEADDISLNIQAWSQESSRPFGLTNLIRVLNDYRERPYAWPAAHLKQHFTPE